MEVEANAATDAAGRDYATVGLQVAAQQCSLSVHLSNLSAHRPASCKTPAPPASVGRFSVASDSVSSRSAKSARPARAL